MRQTILLADDSTTIRRLVKQTFADENFRIVEVSNGDAAIKMLEDMRPSIVLADIYMPGKNGYEVCAYIRKNPALRATPVILLVGAFDAFDEEKARECGATANITKPFEPGALIELVLSVLPGEEEKRNAAESVAKSAPTATIVPEPNEEDLLGLEVIFKDERATGEAQAGAITDEEIDRIADRVIQRLSSQVIESIAWDIVPDITEKIVRQELKRLDES